VSDLTPELSLFTAVDDDDTADYLTLSLRDSLQILDGLFSSATGHRHNGSHQGGALDLDNLVVDSITVNGPLTVNGSASVSSALNVGGLATLSSLDVTFTTRLRGAVTIDGAINAGGTFTVTTLAATDANISGQVNLSGGGYLHGGQLTFEGGASVVRVAPDTVRLASHASVDFDLTVGRNLGVTGTATAGQFNGGGFANAIFNAPASATGTFLFAGGANISYPSGAVGGKPTHVLGQSGDGLMHWWPASAVGPPPLRASVFSVAAWNGAGIPVWLTASLSPVSDGAAVWVGNNTLRLGAGVWAIRYMSGGVAGSSGKAVLRILQSGAQIRQSHAAVPGPTDVADVVSLTGPTDYVLQHCADAAINVSGTGSVYVWFVPTLTYPG